MSRAPLLAQDVMRAAIGRALDTKLTMREMKIFLSLVMLISEYDRTEDRIANLQVAQATGIDERHVRRALLSLSEKNVIRRERGTGRRASLISLNVEGAEDARARRAPSGGADSDVRGGRFEPVAGTPGEPASEVPEVLSEVGVCDLACSKLSTDTPKQHDEARVKVKALVAIHGEDAVRSVLDEMPDACIPFGGELARLLKDRLGGHDRPPRCERCKDTGQTSTGYPCGCPGTAKRRPA